MAIDRDGETLALWVSEHDYLVRKVEGVGAQVVITLALTDLNIPIEISAPI